MENANPRLTDLSKLRELILEKERTTKILVVLVPFWEQPSWLVQDYSKQPYSIRLEMLS
jgi:hypothetical protein